MGKRSRLKKIRQEARGSGEVLPGPDRAPSPGMRSILIAAVLLSVIGFGIYCNAVGGSFIYDDMMLVAKNSYIKSVSNVGKLFVSDIGEGASFIYNFYRPVQTLTYLADYSLWKLDPAGYHLTNIILHIMAALALFLLVIQLCRDTTTAAFASLIFISHPIHTEAVAYISGRADMLAALFGLLTIIFYIKTTVSGRMAYRVAVVLSYILACLSKEYSLIIPLLLLLYHGAFRIPVKARTLAPVFVVAAVYIVMRKTVFSFTPNEIFVPNPFIERLAGAFSAFGQYIKLIFLPFNLHMEYGNGQFRSFDISIAVGAALFGLCLAYLWRERNRDRVIFFSLSWFLITLLPVSNLYPINAYMAEHWLYFPSMGFFMMLSVWLAKAYRNDKLRMLTIVGVLLLVAYYSVLTLRQNAYWRDPLNFYERTLRYEPTRSRILINLGVEYNKRGEREKAKEAFDRAIQLKPRDADLYNNLGSLYDDMGERAKAIEAYRRSIELNPLGADAHNNLGYAYYHAGRVDDAIQSLKKAIELNPRQEDAYNNLGYIYYKKADPARAEQHYKKAIEINPDRAKTYKNLADLYFSGGQYESALDYYERAITRGYKGDANFLERIRSLKSGDAQKSGH